MSKMLKLSSSPFITLLLCLALAKFASGQTNTGYPSLFLDCQIYCDMVYIKQEINFVNHVRDRQVADIYVLTTSQRAGGGSREVQLVFEGANEYANMQDTIVFYFQPNASDAADREILVKNLKKGLLPYLLKSDIIDQIDYNVDIGDTEFVEDNESDPWNYWSYRLSADGNVDGEASFKNLSLSTSVSAQQITEQRKITLFSRYRYSKESFTLTDGEVVEGIRTQFFFFSEYVKSLSDHWSFGFRSDFGSSSFGNTDLEGTITPAIEYNIYPYSDASTRRFSFMYTIGPKYYDYTDLTVFDKLEETVFRHGISMEFEQTQKWGDISVDTRVRQFLHDLSLYSIQFNPNVELNLIKGLRLSFGGYIEYVGDRINVAKSDVTNQDILLQIKQLDTSYSYYSYFGFSYRFGTQRNNIVNPRF